MHFSASDGGGSVSIWDYYDVDDSVGVSGESSAGFSGGLSMANSRSISGPGDVYAVQGYSGSGGYVGMSYIYAQDASQTLAIGSAHLTPGTLGVVQDVSIDGAAESAVVSTGNQGRRSAMQHASVEGGSLDSMQTIEIDGGITTSQDSQMVGFLPTAFGTAGYMDANLGPGTLNIEGEGAAVAVSSLDLAGPAEVDCRLATGTGNSAWAYGDVRSASSDLGAVGAGAGAGNVDLAVDLNGNLYIEGDAEAAGIGVGAIGVENEIRGTLAASTGDGGTSAYGENIEAFSLLGAAGTAAGAGSLVIGLDQQQGIFGGGAEAAVFGAGAAGIINYVSVGSVEASTGNSAEVVARDVDAFSLAGAAGTGVAAGNVQADFVSNTITGEGSAAGSGALGVVSYAGADRLKAESGDSTSAAGKGLTAFVGDGVAGAGAIGATYDSNGPGSGWEVAYVEGDVTGGGLISGDFKADTSNSATASAKNLIAFGNDIHLGSYGDDGQSYSAVDTYLSGLFVDGKLKGYAGDSTNAKQEGHMWGQFRSTAEADSSDPADFDSLTRTSDPGYIEYDLNMKATTDGNGAHTKGKVGWYVDDDRSETIQGAVDAAWNGDKINVKEGTYNENVKIDKSLDVEGAGAGKTIVDGGGVDRTFVVGENDDTVDVTLSDMTIQNGYADKRSGCGGGGGVKNYANLEIRNTVITNNKADCGGGGVKNQYSGTLKVVNSIITDNEAGKGGGGIANNGLLLVKDSEITDNEAGAGGGGIANCGGGTAVVKNTLITDNEADNCGGGIKNDWGYLEVIGSTISNNDAGKGGGGIKNKDGTAVVKNSDITGNTAGEGGGGINNDGGDLKVVNSKISDNSATKGGGGISNCDSDGTVLVKNSEITNNEADHCGGGIKNGGDMTILNSLIANNEAGRGGGGIKNDGTSANLVIKDSEILGNSAERGGGGIDNVGGTTKVIRTDVKNNYAGYCGGGFKNGGYGTLIVKESTISGNEAERGGGGIKNGDDSGSGTLKVEDSVITGNEAGYGGGGIDNMWGSAKVIRTEITDNTAGNCGGGIKNGGEGSAATLKVEDSLIAGNVAEQSGGGIKNKEGSDMEVDGTTITGNTAYGCVCGKFGGGIRNDGTMTLTDTNVFANNPNDIEEA